MPLKYNSKNSSMKRMIKTDPYAFVPPYPAIEYGNRSFPNGDYKVRFDVNTNLDSKKFSIHLEHSISGASFLEKLVEERKARFGCLTSVPQTGYRRLNLSESENQDVLLDLKEVSEPPSFRPVLVCMEDLEYQFSDADGVAEIWQGQSLKIPRGARLARKNYFRPKVSLISLLDICFDDNIDAGTFMIKADTENGFKFRAFVAKDVHNYLKNPSIRAIRRNTIIHMMSRALEILSMQYQSDWDAHANLKILHQDLLNKGLKTWDDEDFQPEYIATQLEPLEFPGDEADL